MTFDFPLILLNIVVLTGIVSMVDIIFCVVKREPAFAKIKRPIIIEYSRAFFPVLLAVFLIRSFVAQPYRVPTGSLEPTVMPGDFIFVNQYDYGLRFPVWNKKIVSIGEPQTGQIALFYYPVDHRFNFVKRVIGVPGDKISYIDKVLYINGKKQPQQYLGEVTRFNDFGQLVTYQKYEENLNGVKHNILVIASYPAINFYNLAVPKGEYFMMGDNRDESDDSRFWGFVPEHDFIGRALFVWMNLDSHATRVLDYIGWKRIGTKL